MVGNKKLKGLSDDEWAAVGDAHIMPESLQKRLQKQAEETRERRELELKEHNNKK